jgi:hypothetical protein
VLSLIDNKEYCKSTGKFNLHLKANNITEEEYVSRYEGGKILTCLHCGTKHLFDKGTWQWAETCHIQKCVGSKWQQTWVQKDPKEHGAKSGAWRNDPVKKAEVSKIVHEANLRVGADGLTGYERTKLKREAILKARTGNKFDAGWDKMRSTWKSASTEHRKNHGEKIKEGVLEKHGVEYVMQVPEILEKQKRTLNRPEERARRSKQCSDMMLEIIADPVRYMQVYEKRCATNLTRYGHENPLAAGKASKQSQHLFQRIYDITGNGKFHNKGGELRIGTFYVDFVYGLKVIEYNGDYWHANPAIYEAENIVKFRHKTAAAKTIWKRDTKRLEFIRSMGYAVKIIWESDFKKNPEQTVQECISWLNESK